MSEELKNTHLYELLKERCGDTDIKGIDLSRVPAMVADNCEKLGDILNRVSIEFKEYTLHDSAHAIRVIHAIDKLLPNQTRDRLTAVDLAVLILAAFAHDTGMAIEREAREKVLVSEEYKNFLLRNESQWQQAEQADQNDPNMAKFLRGQLFQKYLRSRHHELSDQLVRDRFFESMKVQEKSFAPIVAELCLSHGRPVSEVSELKHHPFAGDFLLDMPFLACVFRLADYIDLDPIRAPVSLMELIKPGTEEGRIEWRKHQATYFHICSKKITFSAVFTEFDDEKALRDTLAGLEDERRDVMEFLNADSDRKLHLTLDQPIDIGGITSEGYIYEEFRFKLEYREIMSLLMGIRLYKDDRVFLRELLQNALDACRMCDKTYQARNNQFNGEIYIRQRETDDGSEIIEVMDNGSGMTKHIVKKFFMRVGSSYYQSFAFRSRGLDFEPVSQFGIGILSCFMKADRIEVETRPDRQVHANLDDDERNGLLLDIRGPHKYFVVSPLKRPSAPEHFHSGTTIRVHLNRPITESISQLVQKYLSRTPYKVTVEDKDGKIAVSPTPDFGFINNSLNTIFAGMPDAFGYKAETCEFDGDLGFELRGNIQMLILDKDARRHLRLIDAGKFSSVGFSRIGETLINVKNLTDEVKKPTLENIKSLNQFVGSLPIGLQADLRNICRIIDRLIDNLTYQHITEEVQRQWDSLKAQSEALKNTSALKRLPVYAKIIGILSTINNQLESFVTGAFTDARPTGIVTQDGIDITRLIDFPAILSLGVGYIYNIDLCGEHRVNLNAARDQVIPDHKREQLINYLHTELGRRLGNWFYEEKIPEDQIELFLRDAPAILAENVKRGLDNPRITQN